MALISQPKSLLIIIYTILSCNLIHHCHGALSTSSDTLALQTSPFGYHRGVLLSGTITINPTFYGTFTDAQKAVIIDFISSLSQGGQTEPSVQSWWKMLNMYYTSGKWQIPTVTVGTQISDTGYSLGKSLNETHLVTLSSRASQRNAINVIITASDVTVNGFCMRRCGTHGSMPGKDTSRASYLWVGDPTTQCLGLCSWPFTTSTYGPQTGALVSPNGDNGVEGIIMNFANLLIATMTDPFGDGYRQELSEAVSACPGVFGSGSYPGYPGKLLKDPNTGASYNANGARGRKFALPGMFDPSTLSCATLV